MAFKKIEGSEARFFLTDKLMQLVDQKTLQQVRNTLGIDGVNHVCVLPDCHAGYGAPIGSVVASTKNVLPGPIGYDIGCGMAVYLTNIKAADVAEKSIRRQLIDEIDRMVAMGAGKTATHGYQVDDQMLLDVCNEGAAALIKRGIVPAEWANRCERAVHRIPGGKPYGKDDIPHKAHRGLFQLGTLGGGK